jgi:hypothetical protein
VDYEALNNKSENLFARKLENLRILADQRAYKFFRLFLVCVSAIYHMHLKQMQRSTVNTSRNSNLSIFTYWHHCQSLALYGSYQY